MDALIFWVGLATIVFGYMTLWYGVAMATKRYDVVDSAWGLGFVLVAWVSLGMRDNFCAVQIISAALVSLWGLRLFAHIARRNFRKPEDDHRYQALRDKWGKSADTIAYTHIFLLQGVLLLLVSTPMIAIALQTGNPNLLTYVGWAIWLFGIVFEAMADRQLAKFLAQRSKKSHAIMDKGLWRLSRHPNYFGEVTTWWGATVVALSLGGWWGVLGALTVTLLITKISGIPPLEKHYDGNPDYEKYRKNTPVLIPKLPWRV